MTDAGPPGPSALTLYACAGGRVVLPAASLVLADRADGGNLVIDPPRRVWERSELSVNELTAWSHLVAAAGDATLHGLPQLDGGCVNYWEAGNWAINHAADPPGPKTAPQHRNVHMHLIGRSRAAASPDLKWGEAPRFPLFAKRFDWARMHKRLTAEECAAVVTQIAALHDHKFSMADLPAWRRCGQCGYPTLAEPSHDCRS